MLPVGEINLHRSGIDLYGTCHTNVPLRSHRRTCIRQHGESLRTGTCQSYRQD